MLKGFWIVATLLTLLLGRSKVAVAQLSPSTAPAAMGDLPLGGIVGGSTSGSAANAVGVTGRLMSILVSPLKLPLMSPELALSTYERRTARQIAELVSYSDTTVVRAELSEMSQDGEYELERHYAAPRSLAFEVIRFTGDNFVKRNVIARLLQSEVDHVQKDDPALTAITRANYKFSYKATLMIQGLAVHMYHVKPRKKRVGLFKGHIYLDASTGSLLYAVGSLVKSPSFFIKKVAFVQQDADFGPFTFPIHIHIEASTRLVGRAIVDFDHRNYRPLTVNIQASHQAPAAP